MTDMKILTAAILDGDGRLVGKKKIPETDAHLYAFAAEELDLAADGRYKFDADRGSFIPLGHGFPRLSTKPPIPDDYALFLVIRSLGDSVPAEVRAWADWYDANLRRRTEESMAAVVLRKKGS